MRCCFRWCLRLYTLLFHDPHDQMQVIEAPPALLPASAVDSSTPDTFRAPPRPLPYDWEGGGAGLRGGLVSRRGGGEKGYLCNETEPLQRSGSVENLDSPSAYVRRSSEPQDVVSSGGSAGGVGGDGLRHSSSRMGLGMSKSESAVSLSMEDGCPTCLDGYTNENPQIRTECGHHFHLSCIYEWMERSTHCPVCDKGMVFAESL